jgi:hypothetical protein
MPATPSCAVLLNGSPSRVTVAVAPAAATVQVIQDDGRPEATLKGPTNTIVLSKGHGYVLHVASRGYDPQAVEIKRRLTPAFWLDVAVIAGAAVATVVSGVTATDRSGLSRGLTFLIDLPLVLLGGLGVITFDAATEAMWEHDRQSVTVTLSPTAP